MVKIYTKQGGRSGSTLKTVARLPLKLLNALEEDMQRSVLQEHADSLIKRAAASIVLPDNTGGCQVKSPQQLDAVLHFFMIDIEITYRYNYPDC